MIGILSFACKVVAPGRIFLRRLIDLSTSVNNLDDRIVLNDEAQADIEWWKKLSYSGMGSPLSGRRGTIHLTCGFTLTLQKREWVLILLTIGFLLPGLLVFRIFTLMFWKWWL